MHPLSKSVDQDEMKSLLPQPPTYPPLNTLPSPSAQLTPSPSSPQEDYVLVSAATLPEGEQEVSLLLYTLSYTQHIEYCHC